MRRRILVALLVLVLCPLAARAEDQALLWMQTAAEYRALCLQTYHTARIAMHEAVRLGGFERDERGRLVKRVHGADGRFWLKPVAVVMDLDETVIDNTPFEVFLTRSGRKFEPALWDAWVRYQAATPDARVTVPGAVDFIRTVEALGVTVVYVSNRDEGSDGARLNAEILTGLGVDNRDLATRLHLKKPKDAEAREVAATVERMGVAPDSPEGRALLEGQSSKQRRRVVAESTWHVIGYFGDDLNDFPIFVARKTPPGAPMLEARHAGVDASAARWGADWFVLPNPIYGSWESSLPREGVAELLDDRGFTEYMKAVKP